MEIKITERLIGRVTVLDIVGRLTIDRAADHLKDKVNSLISQERTHIVLNLRMCRTSTVAALASWWLPMDRS